MDYKFEKCQTESEFWLERGGSVKYLIDVAAGRLLRDLFAQCTAPVLQCTAVQSADGPLCTVVRCQSRFAESLALPKRLQNPLLNIRFYKNETNNPNKILLQVRGGL